MNYGIDGDSSVWLIALVRVLRIAVLSYIGFCILFIVKQRRLLYIQKKLGESELVAMLREWRLERWPAGAGSEYRGLVRAEAVEGGGNYKGTVVLFQGNAGCAVDREHYCDQFAAQGWRVVLVEYPGFGARAGSPSETVLCEDGREIVRLAYELYGAPVVIMGESLGAGVAAAVAADPESPAAGLVLATPWDRLSSLAAMHYPWLPVRPFIFDRWDSVKYLKGYTKPISIIVAMEDEVVPVPCSLALIEGLKECSLNVIKVEEAMHNNWFWLLKHEEWSSLLPTGSE